MTALRARGRGFSARLQEASLWDLVQFECLRRSSRAVRVASRGQVGFFFFRDGNLVHASAGRLSGEAAVREMLGWQEGVFDTWNGPGPEHETIDKPWQRVLLEVAQARDEASAPNVLSFPARDGARKEAAEGRFETVALTPEGKLLRGDQSSELPAAAAYAVELGDMIGEFMGLEGLASVEASFEKMHYLVARAPQGDILAARAARAEDLDAARTELGL